METLTFLMISTHFPPHHLGGDAVHVEYLAEELAERGHEVHIFFNPYVSKIIRNSSIQSVERGRVGISMHPLKSRWPKGNLVMALTLGSSAQARNQLSEVIREARPDVIHWHNTKGFIGTPQATHRTVNLYTAHDYFAVCPRSNLLRPDLSTCLDNRDCLFCHLRWHKPTPIWRYGPRKTISIDPEITVISPSEFLARRLDYEGVAVNRVVRNFVPDLREEGVITDSPENELVYVGMLEAHKGVLTMLQGFADSCDEHGFTLTVVGDGSTRTELEKLVGELRVENRVRMTGFISRDELNSIRRRAQYQIVPSEWPENAPLTVLESLSCGVPVIGSDAGGLPEIISDESGSMIFKAGSRNDFADTLRSAWNRIDDSGSARKRARQSYVAKYTPDVYMSNYFRLIKEDDARRASSNLGS
jgi:glycosyltransferase involved in cell wall biosynthesis